MTAFDLLIRGALFVDGTGAPPRPGDLGVVRERIAALGAIPTDAVAARTIDAAGLVLCPGFVDVHTHSDISLLRAPAGESKVRQGVTTEVIGNCSFSAVPLAPDRLALHQQHLESIGSGAVEPTWTDLDGYRRASADLGGTALNLAVQVGHGTLRIAAMGLDDRPPTPDELSRMERLLDDALAQGAIGLSTGLTYPPSMYAATDELVALSRVVARHGGHYATHARGTTPSPFDSIDEAAWIGRESGARVQYSHLAINHPDRWGTHDELLARFEQHRAGGVDIAFDVYPYDASSSTLTQYLPGWVQAGGIDAMRARLLDPEVRARAVAEVSRGWYGGIHWLWDRVVVSRSGDPADRDSPGRSLAELATQAGVPPAELTLRLCEERGNAVEVVLFYRTEEDMQGFLRHPLSTVGSDGLALPADQGDARPHPRSFGTHPRVLGRYARDLGVLGLAEAIHKMTGRAAERMGLTDRGRLAAGLPADLVLFDPTAVADRATFADPCRFPVGIRYVAVAGALVVDGGEQTAARPGRVL